MPGVISLKSRIRRMFDWTSTDLSYRFIAIGRTSAWTNDSNPPYPNETQTEIEELIGLQRLDSYQYAKVIENPTTLDKKTAIYYKGLYYKVTDDKTIASDEGYTSVMCKVSLDRDTVDAIPVGVTFRQVGLYIGVNATPDEIQYGITRAQWDNKATIDKGTLEIIENRGPMSRNESQMEQIYLLVDF